MLSSELFTCHESVSSLKNLNDELNAKLEEANATRSCVEHVVICNRCKDFDVNACDEHLVAITKLNDEVASLNAQLKTCKNDFDKLKFARYAYTVGRHPSIKDGLGFRRETKNLTSHKALILNKEKGKAPMASSPQRNHAFIYDRKIANRAYYNRSYDHDAFNSHAMFASSSTFVHGRSRPRKNHVVHHMPRKCVIYLLLFSMLATLLLYFHVRMKKVVDRKLGAKCKGDKTCIWVPKIIVTNLVGPNKSWVPKT
jgi:hypothetical protein